mgnify:CR=1 FL=1
MKKNFLYSVMALFVILLASCSQEEIISENSENGKITVSVGVPGSATTRAGMPEVESMTRRCIMQVVDENGTAIEGEEMRQTTEVTGDKVNFSFTEPEGEYSVVFWADYVTSIAKDNCYNTAALPNVTLAHNKNTMFTAAGDAFCGKMAKGGSTSIVLKRPFNKIVVGSTNKEAFGECKEIQIAEFSVPDGYNIMSKTCSAAKNIKRERIAMNDATTGEWTSFFVFAPSNQTDTKLELPIMLYKEGDATDAPAIKFTASTSAPTDENMIGSMDIPNIPADKVDVEISFDDKFTNDGSTEPEEPVVPGEIAVGSYIDANGTVTTDESKAIAIVFDLAADDVIANYGETFAGKNIKGWAVAMGKTVQAKWMEGAETLVEIAGITPITNTEKATDINGYGNTQIIKNSGASTISGATFPALTTCIDWSVSAPANTSGWYMPAAVQVQRLHTAWSESTFAGKLTGENLITGVILSSSMYKNSSDVFNPLGVLFDSADNVKNGKINAQKFSNQYGVRPILTIFGE